MNQAPKENGATRSVRSVLVIPGLRKPVVTAACLHEYWRGASLVAEWTSESDALFYQGCFLATAIIIRRRFVELGELENWEFMGKQWSRGKWQTKTQDSVVSSTTLRQWPYFIMFLWLIIIFINVSLPSANCLRKLPNTPHAHNSFQLSNVQKSHLPETDLLFWRLTVHSKTIVSRWTEIQQS